jgi:hypothetical protein
MTKTEYIKQKQDIEEQEFTKLASKLGITKYKFTKLSESYDVKYALDGSYYIAETKVRVDRDIEFFLQHGPFLEEIKLSGMLNAKERIKSETGIDVKLVYLNITHDGYMIYELGNIWDYGFNQLWLPKDNYSNEYKWKDVATINYKPIKIIKK